VELELGAVVRAPGGVVEHKVFYGVTGAIARMNCLALFSVRNPCHPRWLPVWCYAQNGWNGQADW